MTADVREAVLAQIQQDEVIELAKDLVRIPSFTTEETAVARFLARFLSEHGFETELHEVEDGRYQTIGAEALAALEPELAGRFGSALYFAGEGHLDPRAALAALLARALELGVSVRFGVDADEAAPAGRDRKSVV